MSNIHLTAKSYFSNYITHPCAKELSTGQKVLATILTVALSVFTLGFIFIVPLCLRNRKIVKDPTDPTSKKADDVKKNLKKEDNETEPAIKLGDTPLTEKIDHANDEKKVSQ